MAGRPADKMKIEKTISLIACNSISLLNWVPQVKAYVHHLLETQECCFYIIP